MVKTVIYHFHNGTGGGVLTVIKNLLKFSRDITLENHVIYTINKDICPQYNVPVLEGAVSEQVFYYSSKWNFYHTCRQLAKLLPDNKVVIVAHDWLELGMVSNLGLQNPLLQFLHGDFEYYYNLAIKHQHITDQYITISPVIYNSLCTRLPGRKSDIHYCKFPVAEVTPGQQQQSEILKLMYCVRSLTDERKQFIILPQINEELKLRNITVEWTIIGADMQRSEVGQSMNQHEKISFFPGLKNDVVLNMLPQHNLFILPSLKEGFPVAVVEAMKAGLVPLVTNWEGATTELIVHGETGFYFEKGDVDGYVATIALLNSNRTLLNKISYDAMLKANELFNPKVNTSLIEEFIKKASSNLGKVKKSSKVYGSRLDQSRLPNCLVYWLRQGK